MRGTAMHRRFSYLCALFTIAYLSLSCGLAQCQSVVYSGSITKSGLPVNNGYVIVGTFKPSFNPLSNIAFENEYSYDGFGNYCTCDSKYSRGVSDGTFTPIGSGAFTTIGTFLGSGTSLAPAGRQVWMWAFDGPNPDTANTLAVATSSSWITGSNPLTINTAQASSFVFGSENGTAIELAFHFDIPEPSSCTLAGFILSLLGFRRCARLS
jgi:hypothetical protein